MKFWVRNRALPAVMAMLAVAVAGGPAAATGRCLNAAEAEAYRTRAAQTELMVAALKCANRPQLGLPQIYNAFVAANAPMLVDKAKLLTAYFKHRYGPGYGRHQDSFITGLANRISEASNRDPDFCRAAAAHGRRLTASPADGPTAARPVRPRLATTDLPICPAVASQQIEPVAFPTE